MTEKETYASSWNNSAQFFYKNNSYKHLSEHIKEYKTVLEIGCGTGQSTLALLEAGHNVIAIDQNTHCIEKAKQLIDVSGYPIKETADELSPNSVCFVECDITEPSFEQDILSKISPDVVICWNVGTYWDEAKRKDVEQKITRKNPRIETDYAELIQHLTCAIAKIKNCAVQLVDRKPEKTTRSNDQYYLLFKKKYGFKTIKYANIKGTTLSKGGIPLFVNGQCNTQEKVEIIFISILMT